MRRILLIILILWISILGAFCQQIVFDGKKYDYRLSFPEHEKVHNIFYKKENAPLAIYLSRNGKAVIAISGKKVYETTFTQDDIIQHMYADSASFSVFGIIRWITFTSQDDKNFELSLTKSSVHVKFKDSSGEVQKLRNNESSDFPPLAAKTIDNISRLVEAGTFFRLPAPPVGTKRIPMKGTDERTWYLLKKGGLYGAQNSAGQTIIPCEYDTIIYRYYKDHESYDDNSDEWVEYNYEERYFKANKKDNIAIYTTRGTCVIPAESGYTSASLVAYHYDNMMGWQVETGKFPPHDAAFLDARGKTVVPITKIPKVEGLSPDRLWFRFHRSSFGKNAPIYIELSAEYFGENKSLDGLYDINGTCYAPVGKYKGGFEVLDDVVLLYPEKVLENTERINVALPNRTTQFDYTPFDELLTIEKEK